MTNEQKKDWFLRLDPNGRIPVILDNTKKPPFPVMETSAELLYLLKEYDSNDAFGFKDEFERNQAVCFPQLATAFDPLVGESGC